MSIQKDLKTGAGVKLIIINPQPFSDIKAEVSYKSDFLVCTEPVKNFYRPPVEAVPHKIT